MPSLREIMGCSFSVPRIPKRRGIISIVHDFFGHNWIPDGVELSLRTQVRRLQGKHIHLNLIRVGIENFEERHHRELDSAVHVMRDLYAQVHVGVGRIEFYYLTEAQANELDIFGSVLGSTNDYSDMTDEYTVPNDGLDIFILLLWDYFSDGVKGRSPNPGPCDKDDSACDATGCAISLEGNRTGLLLAHEVGHYLDLDHVPDMDAEDIQEMIDETPGVNDIDDLPEALVSNVMCPTGNRRARILTPEQGAEMKERCQMKPAC